jgi:hypothetical protein
MKLIFLKKKKKGKEKHIETIPFSSRAHKK